MKQIKEIRMIRKLITMALSTSVVLLLGVIPASALWQYATMEEYEEATGKKIEKFSEAPMLRTKVAAGELPPVEERLPEDFAVVEPLEEIGQYGGTLYSTTPAADYAIEFFILNGGSGITVLHLAPDCKTIIPNIAKGWDLSEDGKSLVLYLRKGMRWSDGELFTADDMMFWYEDIILNDELTPVKPEMWSPGGKLMKVEKIDDYAVRFRFDVPYPPVLLPLASLWDMYITPPKHYLTQFHIDYNPNANELAKENGFDNWFEYFLERNYTFLSISYNPDLPVLTPYKITKRTSEYWEMERNPYYWKVDTEGNQLPYIDKHYGRLLTSSELYQGAIIAGEVDYALISTSLENYTLYQESAEKGNYRVLPWKMGYSSIQNYIPNQNVKDPVLRKIFQDVRFRKALSLAINREDINESIFFGLGKPAQFTALPASDYYEERFSRSYADYDPDEANGLLDEMGLKWDEDHEYRLRPDGKVLRFIIPFSVESAWGMAGVINELVRENWKDIGVDMLSKEVGRSTRTVLLETNDFDMWINWGDAASNAMIFWDQHFVTGSWCPEWDDWRRSGGQEGTEPIAEVRRNIERWTQMRTTTDDDERIRLGKEIMRSQAENLWEIGTVSDLIKPLIARKNLRNVINTLYYTGDFNDTGPSFPEQYFLKQG